MGASRSALLAAAALGLGFRLAFGFGYWTHQPLTRDEREYLSLARGLASGRGFVYDEEILSSSQEPFGRAPGYPAFLALAGGGRAVTSSVPASVKLVQSIVGAAGVVLIGLLAARLVGTRAGTIAAALGAVYPPLVWVASYAWSEAIAWPLGLLVVWWFDRAAEARQDTAWKPAAIAGVLTGIAILVRPSMLLFVPFALGWLAWRRRFTPALAMGLAAAIVIGPWTLRNISEYGRFVLVATEGGVTFWTGNHPRAIGEGDLAANPHLKLESQELRRQHPALSEEAMEPVYYREALAWMRSHPIDWVWLEIRKAFYLVLPIGPSYTLHSRLYYGASVLSYGLALPIALIGLARLGPRRARTPGLWLLVGSAIATCLIFFPQERFRIPVIDPALVICAGAAFASRHDAEGRA
ncbi:MAG TPA: glycosyltransferase family 39 protein [Vicinamibacterales bacterium]|nr:glycosyltransferase family 39 protein [Vicinamibacterales bacterium]